jgi:hypothetical protein
MLSGGIQTNKKYTKVGTNIAFEQFSNARSINATILVTNILHHCTRDQGIEKTDRFVCGDKTKSPN